MSRLRGRTWMLVAAGTAVLGCAVAVPAAAATTASGATRHAASTASTFSAPAYYMFRNFRMRMDCVVSNPGCSSGHTDQSMTLQSVKPGTQGGEGNYLNVPVYPTGSGIVHIGAIHTAACGPQAPALGNWVWVDHGGGVVSRYAHLSGIAVTNGQQVTPRTVLGKTGNSGEHSTCWVYYLNYQLRHGGVNGTPVALTTLRACSGQTTVLYPTYQNHAWKTFNNVPKNTFLLASGSGCVPGR